jgi:SAM-dependent methyltransferase
MSSNNVNDHFFQGYYKDIWKTIIPDGLTRAEVDFLIEAGKLNSESRVLDLMCGYGRHALALGRHGSIVTAVDNLLEYTQEVNTIVKKENLPVTCIVANVLEFNFPEVYDLIICMGNSLCFFDETALQSLFQKISDHLQDGGVFVFNSWMIAEIAIKNFREKNWNYVGDLKFLTSSEYSFSPAKIETESTIIATDGTTEIKRAVDYIYSINEMERIFKAAGLEIRGLWSIPRKKKFALGDARIYFELGKAS